MLLVHITVSVFDKPLDEVFDTGTTLSQITQYVSNIPGSRKLGGLLPCDYTIYGNVLVILYHIWYIDSITGLLSARYRFAATYMIIGSSNGLFFGFFDFNTYIQKQIEK